MKSFVDTVKIYSAWKLKEKGNGKLSRKELLALREQFKNKSAGNKLNESTQKQQLNKMLKEKVEIYKNWKLKEKGTEKLTEAELKGLKAQVITDYKKLKETKNTQSWETFLANYKHFKESKNINAKLSYKELKLLKESFKTAQEKGIKLREADQGFDPSMAAPQAGDPNAMAGGDPNAAAGAAPAQDPMAMQGAIDQAIQALTPFSQSGANPMAGDPNAGLPPVDGTQPADPNAAGAMPMQEAVTAFKAWKLKNKGTDKLTENEVKFLKEKFGGKPKSRYEQIKERIAERQKKLEALQENGAQDLARKELNTLGLGSKIESNSSGKGSVEGGEELVKPPAASTLANGYTSGEASKETKPAKTWPTKAVGKEAGGALQGAGATQTKVKESEEEITENHEDKLAESVKTVTDVYVDRYLNDAKLDFKALKESFKTGLLG